MSTQPLSELTTALCMVLILLVPFAVAGLAMMNTGVGRPRSVAHMMLSSLVVFSVAAAVFFAVGFSWQGYSGGSSHAVQIGGKAWSWIAAEPFFWRGLTMDGSKASLAALLGMMCAGLSAVIPLGGGGGRWRLSGEADGWRNLVPIMDLAKDLPTLAERYPYKPWAA